MRNKVYLAGQEFPSLTAARMYTKSILDTHVVGDRVLEGEKTFLMAAIALRGTEKLAEKVGAGIAHIFVQYNEAGDKAFYIQRVDGSITDFSYIKCFSKPSTFTDFSNACRNAIREDKASLKAGLGYDSHHVHHKDKAFKNIIQAFIDEQRLDLTKVDYLQGDGVEGWLFRDEDLARAFKKFHNQQAALQVISVKDHKALHKIRE